MEKISVIVPVYNVEKYLGRCVDSILAQTYKNIEIILVDDGSTDGSGKICDEYGEKFPQIKVVHQENQGLGGARNTGLLHATGEYVGFIDSDDWIAEETYETLLGALQENGCEVAACGRVIADGEGKEKQVFCADEPTLLEGEQIIARYLMQEGMNMSACDKLFKRELFEGITFPLYYVSEDVLPIYRLLKKTKRLILTGKPFYYYFTRPNSLSRNTDAFTDRKMGQYLYAKQVAEDVKKCYSSLAAEAEFYLYDAMIIIWRKMRATKYKGEERKTLLQEFKKNKKAIWKNDKVYVRQKIFVFLIFLRLDRLFDKIYSAFKK